MRPGRLLCRLGILAAAVVAFTVVTPVASAQTAAETEPTEEQIEDTQPESEEPETTEPPEGLTAAQKRALALKRKRVLTKIKQFRKVTWRWQKLMRVSRTPASRRAERSPSLAYQRWVLRYWKTQARKTRRKALNPPRKAAWLCIHRHEGPWSANTGNGYYGGLQMDLAFQRAYGSDLLRKKGTANRWRPIEQIWVAERAYRSGRGFYPWPNTARTCGVL